MRISDRRASFRPDHGSVLPIVGLAFLRYLSDRQLTQDGANPATARCDLFLPAEARWERLSSNPTGEALLRGVEAFERHPANRRLGNVLTALGLRKLAEDERYQDIQLHVSEQFRTSTRDEPFSVLEHVTERVMRNAGWRGGEYYTPRDLSSLLAELLNPKPGCSIYDPACGTGALLNSAHSIAVQADGDGDPVELYGQDAHAETAALAKINTALRAGALASVATGDTLLNPRFVVDEASVQTFDYVVCNPPLGLRLDRRTTQALENDPFGRFSHGVTRTAGDLLFVQHVLASLKEGGRAVMLVSPRALTAPGEAENVRRALVESDAVEAVVSLPGKLLLGTAVPIAVLVLSKGKPPESEGGVLFVYAEDEYGQDGLERRIGEQQRERLVRTVLERREQHRVSSVVSLEAIGRQGYRLAPGEYVDLVGRETLLGGAVHWKKIEEIAEVRRGNGTSTRSGTDVGTPLIRGRDLNALRLTVDDLTRVELSEDANAAMRSQAGDVLVQRMGMSPRAFFVDEDLSDVLVGDGLYVIRPREGFEHLTRYLAEFLNSDPGQALLSPGVRGASVPTLHHGDLRNLRVPVPENNVVRLVDGLYEVERDLIGRVDRAREIRQRLFGIDDPEQATALLNDLSTEARMLAGSLLQVEHLDFQVRNFYPYPVAYSYRTLSAFQQPAELYQEQLRVAENVLAFLGILGVALAAHGGKLTEQESSHLPIRELLGAWEGGISPGHWQALGRRAALTMRDPQQTDAMQDFASLWFKGKGTKASDLAKKIQSLVTLKNDHKHDRGPKTPVQLEKGTRELQELIDGMLAGIRVLLRYPLRLVVDTDIDWQTTEVVADTLLYAGDHPGLQKERVTLPRPLPKDKLYAILPEDEWIPLYPLVDVRYCSRCDTRETYFIDAWNGPGDSPKLKSFERGHKLDDPDVAALLSEHLTHWLRTRFDPTSH